MRQIIMRNDDALYLQITAVLVSAVSLYVVLAREHSGATVGAWAAISLILVGLTLLFARIRVDVTDGIIGVSEIFWWGITTHRFMPDMPPPIFVIDTHSGSTGKTHRLAMLTSGRRIEIAESKDLDAVLTTERKLRQLWTSSGSGDPTAGE